jgi:hypothetical protein
MTTTTTTTIIVFLVMAPPPFLKRSPWLLVSKLPTKRAPHRFKMGHEHAWLKRNLRTFHPLMMIREREASVALRTDMAAGNRATCVYRKPDPSRLRDRIA